MWIFHNQEFEFTSESIRNLPIVTKPNLHDRAIALIRDFARHHSRLGISFRIELSIVDGNSTALPKEKFADMNLENQIKARDFFRLLSLTWSRDGHELRYLLHNYMKSELKWISDISNAGETKITPTGWKALEAAAYAGTDSEIGFVAMWFKTETDNLWAKGIEPAIQKAGYRAFRIDKEKFINKIDDEIILRIRESRFVVADFTGGRDAVSFESGFAMGLGVPVFYTCREDQADEVNFDQNHYPFIRWTDKALPALVEELSARIMVVIGRGPRYEVET